MKSLITVFVLMIGFTICRSQNLNKSVHKIAVEGVLTVHIKSVSQAEIIQLRLVTYHSFPQNDVSSIRDSITAEKNEIYLKIRLRTLGESFLSVADSIYKVVGAPGDTIHLSIHRKNIDTSKRLYVIFGGKNKEIQQYYQAKTQLLGNITQTCIDEGIQAVNLISFQRVIDTAYQKQHQFWTDYQNKYILPNWFKAYEINAINYSDAWARLYIAWYQINYQKKRQIVPDSYYDFKIGLQLKNEAALFQYDYLRFLRQQLQFSQPLSSKDLMNCAKKELGENVGAFFEIWELSRLVNKSKLIEAIGKKQFPPHYKYLVDYINQRASEKVELLKVGDKAPNFALIDAKDSLITLTQYKGQVVYLSFWFTTCGGCVKEMPYENKLVEQFKGKPVKIISICIGTPGVTDDQQIPRWKATSKRFGLKTIDLYANRAWTKTLSEKYIVDAYPHYVLIGTDGNIIENLAERPSQGIAVKIEKVLAVTEK